MSAPEWTPPGGRMTPRGGKDAPAGPRFGQRRSLFGAAAGTLGAAAAAGSAEAARPGARAGSFVQVDDFPGPAGADDTAAIVWALAEAVRLGAAVVFSGRVYRISETIDLPTGVQLLGMGAVSGAEPGGLTGTVLQRVRDIVMLRAKGKAFERGGPMRHSIMIRGLLLHGDDHPSDLVQLISAARITIEDCFFIAAKGRLLLLWEVFDSRIVNTDFEWGGVAGGRVPMVELRSGSGLEYTNQIHFTGCRMESYPGTALAMTGSNTNEIFFTNCKLESLLPTCVDPAIAMGGANVVRFGGVQVTSRGNAGAPMRALVSARGCSFVTGDLYFEHLDYDGKASRLAAYLDLSGSQGVDLRLVIYDGATRLPLEACVAFDRSNAKACSVRGLLKRGAEVVAHTWSA